MRKTNIMVEFSEEVYDILVEPMKKNKSFSKLIAALVNGYLNDAYVRAYADDTLDDLRRASVDAFNESLDSMSESLSNMGLFTDELESTASLGKKKFKEKAEKYGREYQKEGYSKNSSEGEKSDNSEIKELKKQMSEMQASFNETLKTLVDTMKSNQGNINVAPGIPISGMQGYGMYYPGYVQGMYNGYGVGVQGFNGMQGVQYGTIPNINQNGMGINPQYSVQNGYPMQGMNPNVQQGTPIQNISQKPQNIQGMPVQGMNPSILQNAVQNTMQGINTNIPQNAVQNVVQGMNSSIPQNTIQGSVVVQQPTQSTTQAAPQNIPTPTPGGYSQVSEPQISSQLMGTDGSLEKSEESVVVGVKSTSDDDLGFKSEDISIFSSFGDTNLSVDNADNNSNESTSSIDEEDDSEASSFMSSMLEGNAFAF